MARLIDADAIEYDKRIECFGHGEYYETQKVYKEDIDKMPTVDAVEVVRCEDCKHWDKDFLWCDRKNVRMAEDDFCSYGEKK